MDQLDIAIHQTAHNYAGKLPKLASQMGKSEQVFRNKVNYNCDSHILGIRKEAIEALYQLEAAITADDKSAMRKVG